MREKERERDLVTFGDGRVADVKVTRAGREIIIDHGAACRVRCEVRCSDVGGNGSGGAGNQYRPEAPADRLLLPSPSVRYRYRTIRDHIAIRPASLSTGCEPLLQ